ncbi:MAG: NAD(P)H-binding protein [Bacteroidota bacterium]
MKIAFFGASGMLGTPVANRLAQDGHELKALLRNVKTSSLPQACEIIQGDLKDIDAVRKTILGCNAIYISLSVAQSSREKDFQPEREGILNILQIAAQENIKAIGYLSSLVQNYQGMNGFDWWAFRIKNEAVEMISAHPIPSLIFRPSTFMENFDLGSYQQAGNIALAGTSEHPMYFIAAADYAKMVSNAFRLFDGKNEEYIIQGPEAYIADDAARIFTKHYTKKRMLILKLPFWTLQFFGKLTPKFNYGANIVEALNKFPERFQGTATWEKLGKPELNLEEYARMK